ncbi:hypothetical protein Tco_1155092 [Tanacetum coccineum]
MDIINFTPLPPLIRKPEKQNLNKFCDYHGDRGNNTNDCYHLKKQIEEAVALGKLAHLMNDIPKGNQRNRGQGRGSVKVINMVGSGENRKRPYETEEPKGTVKVKAEEVECFPCFLFMGNLPPPRALERDAVAAAHGANVKDKRESHIMEPKHRQPKARKGAYGIQRILGGGYGHSRDKKEVRQAENASSSKGRRNHNGLPMTKEQDNKLRTVYRKKQNTSPNSLCELIVAWNRYLLHSDGESSISIDPHNERIYIGRESSKEGFRVGLVPVDPEGKEYSHDIRLNFHAFKDDMHYKALLATSDERQMKDLHVFVSSKLLVDQVEGNREPKKEGAKMYMEVVMDVTTPFHKFRIMYLPKTLSPKTEALTGLTSIQLEFLNQEVSVGVKTRPLIDASDKPPKETNNLSKKETLEKSSPTWEDHSGSN